MPIGWSAPTLLRSGLVFDLRRALFRFAGSAVNDLLGSSFYLATGLFGRMTGGFGGIFGAFLHGVACLFSRVFGGPAGLFYIILDVLRSHDRGQGERTKTG